MIERIKDHPVLSQFLKDACSENDIEVSIDPLIDPEDIVIISVDDFYNSLNIEHRPPLPDCLVLVRCEDGGFALTVVELKNIRNSQGFRLQNMLAKYETCFNDFISQRFRELLLIDYKKVYLYFVSGIELYRRDAGLKMDVLINTKFNYNGKRYGITPYMPSPTIRRCY